VVAQLLEVVRRIHATGVTLVVVEQSLNIAAELCDRAVFLEKGQVRFEGPTQELLARDDIARAVFLGSAPPAQRQNAT
jgi:ABC-type branched-subunit amino acid transport system ATPase component